MTTRGMAIAAAVAGLFTATTALPAVASAEEKGKVACQGINSCKGQSDCKSAKNACAGKNGCKGQGIKYVSSEKECTDKGGTVVKK